MKARRKLAQKFEEEVSAHPACLLAHVLCPEKVHEEVQSMTALLHDHEQLVQDATCRQKEGSKGIRDQVITVKIEGATD